MTSMEGGSCTTEGTTEQRIVLVFKKLQDREARYAGKKLMQRAGSHGFNNLG